jgi:hypothetical protein
MRFRRRPTGEVVVELSDAVAAFLLAAVAHVPRPDPWTTVEEACVEAMNAIADRYPPTVLMCAERVLTASVSARRVYVGGIESDPHGVLIAAADWALLMPFEVLP